MIRVCHDLCDAERANFFMLEEEKDLIEKLDSGDILKENRHRIVKRFPEGILKEFVSSKAHRMGKREFTCLSEAFQRGIPSPQPYWLDDYRFFEIETDKRFKQHVMYLYMEDMGDAPTLYDVSRERSLNETELESLGQICHLMIQKGCQHLDFHAGNVLCFPEGMKVVDWGKADFKVGPLMQGEAFKLLLGIFSSLEPLSHLEHLKYLKAAMPELGLEDLDLFYRRLYHERQKVWEKHFHSRARKAVEESGSWAVLTQKPLRIHHKELPFADIERVIDDEPSGPFLKQDRKTRLWLAKAGDKTVVVKEFLVPQFWQRVMKQNRCRVSWMNTVQLKARSLLAPKPLAFKENPDGTGRVIMEYLEGAEGVDRYVHSHYASLSADDKHLWLQGFIGFLKAYVHRQSVPTDLKTCNIMVKEGVFYLVDHDGMRFGASFDNDAQLKAFTQLHLSTPRAVSYLDRYRVLHSFVRDKIQAKVLWQQVKEASQGENILYQGPDGDVSTAQ